MLLAVFGTWEVVIILAVVLLIFGPSKLPQLGEGIGKMLRGFKKEMRAAELEKPADPAAGSPDEIDVTPGAAEGERDGGAA